MNASQLKGDPATDGLRPARHEVSGKKPPAPACQQSGQLAELHLTARLIRSDQRADPAPKSGLSIVALAKMEGREVRGEGEVIISDSQCCTKSLVRNRVRSE